VMHVGFFSMTHQELLSALSVEGGGPSICFAGRQSACPPMPQNRRWHH
jgi:hypothetical protein